MVRLLIELRAASACECVRFGAGGLGDSFAILLGGESGFVEHGRSSDHPSARSLGGVSAGFVLAVDLLDLVARPSRAVGDVVVPLERDDRHAVQPIRQHAQEKDGYPLWLNEQNGDEMPSLLYAGNKEAKEGTSEITVASGAVQIGTVGTFTAAEQQALSASYYLEVPGSAGVVVANGPPTVQTITIYDYPRGSFFLTFGGQTTVPLSTESTNNIVQAALQALSSIGAGNCTVTGPQGGPYVVTFAGALAGSIQAAIVATGTALSTTPDLSKHVWRRK